MRCEMCGYEFEGTGCNACKKSCSTCRCPACGYSQPSPSRVLSFLQRIRGTKDGQ